MYVTCIISNDLLISSISIDQLTSILDSDEFQLDKNYHRVEPTLDCHQKESVQVRIYNSLQNVFLCCPFWSKLRLSPPHNGQ